MRLDIDELKYYRFSDEPVIFIANHPSRLDTVILTGTIPNMVCITKPTIWRNKILGPTLQQGGYICFNKILNIIGPAQKRIKEGCPLFVFPEGTRSGPLGSPEKIFSGFAALALGTQAHIQVLFIETDSPYLSQGWSFLKCPQRLPMSYRIKLGPYLEPPRNEEQGRLLIQRIADIYRGSKNFGS